MKKNSIQYLAVVAALMIGTLAWAADMDATSPVTGKITYVDTATGRFTVEDASGTSTTFDTTGSTSYMQSGRTVMLSDLKVGDQVTVTASGTAGQRTAMNVNYGTTAGTTGSAYNTGSTTTGSNYNTGSTTTGSTTTGSTPTGTYDRNNNMGSTTGSTYDRNTGSTTTGSNYDRNTGSAYNSGSTTTGTTNSYDRNTTANNNRLPRTASPLPLLGLAGLILLGAGAAMKVRTRSAN